MYGAGRLGASANMCERLWLALAMPDWVEQTDAAGCHPERKWGTSRLLVDYPTFAWRNLQLWGPSAYTPRDDRCERAVLASSGITWTHHPQRK